MPKNLIAALILVLFTNMSSAEEHGKKSEPAPPKGQEPKPWESWDKYRQQMIAISRQLGVTCNYCHNTRNYRDHTSPKWKMGKKHIEMVDMLNDKFKTAFSDKVDCYMCHKGVAKPEFKEKAANF